MENHPPYMFGIYKIIRSLGHGGFAQVYLVEDNLGRQWALKQIRQDLVKQDPGFRERFKREAHIQAGLKHDHIAGVHDFNAEEGYLVIEYIRGKTLQTLLNDDYPDGMDLLTALEILRPIEEALTYIHTVAGYAHLDVTPRNILVEEARTLKGKTEWRIVLADFGLAHVIDADGRADPTNFAGAPGYWAPEQRGPTKDKPGIRSDIYTLGLVIGVMLTGRKPQEVLGILRGTESTLPTLLPSEVKRVLQRATDENPGNRYATVKGLVTAFTKAVEAFDPEKTLTDLPSKNVSTKRTSTDSAKEQPDPGQFRKVVAAVSPYYALVTTVVLLGFIVWLLVQSLPVTHFTQLNGVDLGRYCRSLGYQGNNADVACSSTINLDLACNWQHETTGLHFQLTNPKDLDTGNCYDARGNVVGGINDMDGYCKDPRQGYFGVPAAEIVGNTWVCTQKIDMTLVCMWQFSRTDVQARKNDQGNWMCYGLW